MNNFYSFSYQQSDDDYQPDFNYNCTQFVDEDDIFSTIDEPSIYETIDKETQSILNTFQVTRMRPALTTTQPNYTRKSITNTSVILPDNVYKSLFKMHPSDAYIFGIDCEPQNVINV